MPTLRIKVGLVVNPLIYGLAYISSMPALSAPSAKSFSATSGTRFICIPLLVQYPGHRGQQAVGNEVRALGPLLRVTAVDPDSGTAGLLARDDVLPAISDHD